MTIEIVDLPIENMVDLSSSFFVYMFSRPGISPLITIDHHKFSLLTTIHIYKNNY